MDEYTLAQGVQEEQAIRTYRRRWAILALFSFANACNAILWISFSPINSLVVKYYGISSSWVNGLSIVFLAAYVPASVLSNWVFFKWGSRVGLCTGAILNALSALIRFLSTEDNSSPRGNDTTGFAILFAGQTLGAISQPFFTNMPAKIATLWFPADERDIATVIGALFNPVGIAIGSILPTLFIVGDPGSGNDRIDMFTLLLVELIIVAAVSSLVLIGFRSKPPTPPSTSEASRLHEMSLMDEFKALLKNKHFMVIFICFGSGLGFFNALTTLVEQLVDKSGYSSDDASLFSGLLLGCGIVSALVVGYLLDKTHRYKEFLRGGFALAFPAIVAFVLVLRPNNIVAISIVFALMGGIMLPMLPVAFESAAECTYPISEDMSTGLLMSSGQITGIIFIVGVSALLDQQPTFTTYVFEPAYILIVVMAAFFCGGVQLFNGPYLRLQADSTSVGPDNAVDA